jgi:phage FluMu protein Com
MAKVMKGKAMPRYRVKRYWEVCDSVEVIADSVGKAIIKAHALPLSKKPEFVPDSIDSDPNVDVEQIGQQENLECNVCNELVEKSQLRSHLEAHNPNAKHLSWVGVCNQFSLQEVSRG